MGRKSALTDKQWADIEKRMLAGEPARALAREFGISEAAIRKKLGARTKTVKEVANQLVAAEKAFESLPIGAQISARTLADELKAVSMHLAGAAKFGAATAHRLSGIANAKVAEIDDAMPLDDEASIKALKGIAALTDLSNRSAEIPLKLLAANKSMIDDLNKDAGALPPPAVVTYEEQSAP